ncbi:MAG: GDSL-type esterase/lipase family protein [Chitinophagales bacterium]
MEKNKLGKSALLPLILLIGLLASYFVKVSIIGYELKSVDILSDVRVDTIKKKKIVSASKKQISDTCLSGLTCFEDYSDDTSALNKIFEALYRLKQSNKTKVRIGFFGDSFIEGDIFCADFRDTLQTIFGGNGVGYVPITSEVSQFRTTVQHSFYGFNTYSIVKNQSNNIPLGAAGFCIVPNEQGCYAKYSANMHLPHLDQFHDIKLFYKTSENLNLKCTFNSLKTVDFKMTASPFIQQLIWNRINVSSIKFDFPLTDKLRLYGVSFEDSTGIYVDNFGVRGNSGLGLLNITNAMHHQFDSLQNYNLIILQYGLNVISADTKDVSWYKNTMVKMITQMKSAYPNASFLLVSVSDRSMNVNGEYRTMQTIPMLVDAQRQIAKESKIAFWDLFSAMGGDGSMVYMVNNDPPLANKDYTHLNAKGGKKIADIFAKTILYELKKYNEKKK